MDPLEAHALKLHDEGLNAFSNKDYEKALELFEESLKWKQNLYPPESKHVAVAYEVIAVTSFYLKKYLDAIANFGKAIGIHNKINGTDFNQKSARLLIDMGNSLYHIGRDKEAIEVFKKGAEILFRLEGENSETGLFGKAFEGRSLYKLGEYEKAINLLNDISERCLAALGRDNFATSTAFLYLGKSWETVAEKLKNSVTRQRYKDFIMYAASGYANSKGYENKAQSLLDFYNSL